MIQLFGFFIGLAVGSFINVLVARLPKKKGVFWGRSCCPYCRRVLKWHELVPIISFCCLKGKCRSCQKPISRQYPVVEFVGGVGFFILVGLPLAGLNIVWLAVLFSLALLLGAYDAKHLILPDSFLALFLLWAIIGNVLFWRGTIIVNLLSGIVVMAFFLALFLVSSGRWIGGGDVKLGGILGFWLGWPGSAVMLLGAYFLGALVAGGLLIIKKATRHSQISFGPFLLIAAFIAFLWGDEIIGRYLALLGI